MLSQVKAWLGLTPLSEAEFEAQRRKLLAERPIPVFWLFGKTGSGKTSVIHYLTGATEAEIGTGFRPCTQASRLYDFPGSDEAIVRFLDTRGLGEIHYDPAEDLQKFDALAHVILVTVRVMDHSLEEILGPLRQIRQAQPTRPIVLLPTCLHEGYPGEQHPDPDPFGQGPPWSETLPTDLSRSLSEITRQFEGLYDRVVPIDFTRVEEGFHEPDFGGARLDEILVSLLPAAYRQAFLSLSDVRKSLQNLTVRQALPLIVTYSSLAATAAAVPTPWLDIPVVMGLQTHLVYRIAELYGQKMETELLLKMAGAVGGRLLTRFAVRAPLKFIPVVGQTANAAMAFAYTYSLGQACCWYFGEVKAGHLPSSDELNRVWADQLQSAMITWKSNREATT